MSKPSQKKLAKQRQKKAQSARREHESEQRMNMRRSLPRVNFDNNASEQFQQAVRQAWRTIAFEEDPAVAGSPTRDWWDAVKPFLHWAKRDGFKIARDTYRQWASSHPEVKKSTEFLTSPSILEEMIFGRLTPQDRKSYFPCSMFFVRYAKPKHNEITIELDSLRTEKTSGGTVYFSDFTPTVEIDGRRHRLAFSTHAVERIHGRGFGDATGYVGAYSTFMLLYDKITVEKYQFPDGEAGAKIYTKDIQDLCPDFPEEVLGNDFQPGARYEAVVGYCPMKCERDLWIATTLLEPGMRQTPETGLLDLRKVDLRTKQLLKNTPFQPLFQRLVTGQFTDARLRHQHGIEQIRPLNDDD